MGLPRSARRSPLPLLLVLACALMVIFMMRGMGGHNHGHSDPREPSIRETESQYNNHHR